MPAGLVVPVSGPYTGLWGGFPLGTQNDDGFALVATIQGQEINATDAYGMTLVEAIYRGINWRLRFRGLEWNKGGLLYALQIFGSTGAPQTTFTPTLANIGQRFTAFTQALSLNSILGTYPPTIPSSLTALNAVAAPQMNAEYLMTSKAREAPIEMVLLPYSATVGSLTVNLAFTTT